MKDKSIQLLLCIIIGLLAICAGLQVFELRSTSLEYKTKWVAVGQRDALDNKMSADGWEVVNTIRADKDSGPGRSITYKRRR